MIGFYVFYVVVVVGWHTYTKRRSARRAKEAASRGHFYRTTVGPSNDELEPYRDAPDDDDPSVAMGRSSATTDIGSLERGPLIEIGVPEQDGQDEADRNQHVAAEVSSSMRVTRPRGRRSNTIISPIRPSLVGALEFRSVLASLQREGNVHMRPIITRGHSTDHVDIGPRLAIQGPASPPIATGNDTTFHANRARALSSGAIPMAIDHDIAGRHLIDTTARSHGASHTIGGRLAPPLSGDRMPETSSEPVSPLLTPVLHQLRIPSPSGSERSTPHHSPLLGLTDSPLLLTPNTEQPSYFHLPSPATELPSPFPSMVARVDSKPVKWWPYQYLPPPHVLLHTLFPTLQAWHNKSIWDKFVSVISVPSIFLLVITLPVVENDTTEDEFNGSIVEEAASLPLPAVPPTSTEDQETEWQRYRRSTRSTRSRASSRSPSPSLIDLSDRQNIPRSAGTLAVPVEPITESHLHKPPSNSAHDTSTIYDDDQGWNRWLLVLQIFMGPLFCVFVVWANVAEDLQTPIKDLVRAILISLVLSLALLGVLLATTSPDRRPKYHVAFCFLGFVIAIAWISTVAGEVVGVMKAFGVILGISEAILGLTIFAVGNSIGDLVADVTVARLGYPVMALYVVTIHFH